MIRAAGSLIIGFIMLFLQGYIVMRLNGYTSLAITYPAAILAVWLINSSLAFSLLSQLKPWFLERLNLHSKS